MPVPKKMRLAEDKFAGDSDHQSDGEAGVQPMMTKIKTVLKSKDGLIPLNDNLISLLTQVLQEYTVSQ